METCEEKTALSCVIAVNMEEVSAEIEVQKGTERGRTACCGWCCQVLVRLHHRMTNHEARAVNTTDTHTLTVSTLTTACAHTSILTRTKTDGKRSYPSGKVTSAADNGWNRMSLLLLRSASIEIACGHKIKKGRKASEKREKE